MSNRAAKYEQLHKSLKKHFKPQSEPGERSVLEHLIYACCLEDARTEQADEAFAKLQQAYFDWNEVRVTTVIELGEALSSLPNATQAGHRIKRCLQSLFETRYEYNLDDMKKANLSKSTDELTALKGVSAFVLNYVSQNALGGHAIPVDTLTLEIMVQCEIITAAEAEKRSLPGVERAIPKNKGFEFGSLLHQFAVEFQQNPKNADVLAVFKELGVSPKAKEVEKSPPKKEPKKAEVAVPVSGKAKSDAESAKVSAKSEPTASAKKTDRPTVTTKEVADKAKLEEPKKPESKKPETKKSEAIKSDVKKPDATKSEVKKPDLKKPEAKTQSAKVDAKPAAKKPDAKPAVKAPDKKDAAPAKASKPEPAAKKSVPAKKPAEIKPTPTKKKPR